MASRHRSAPSRHFSPGNDVQYFLLFWELPPRLGWRFVKDQVRRTDLSVGKTCDRVLPNSVPHVECVMRTAEDAKLGFDFFIENGMAGIEDRTFITAWGRRRKGSTLEVFDRKRYMPSHRHHEREAFIHCNHFSPPNRMSRIESTRQMRLASTSYQPPIVPEANTAAMDDQNDSLPSSIIPYSRAVTISGLPDDMNSAAARQFLSKWGDVLTCVVHPPSICKVQFEFAGDVINLAKHLHGTFLYGRQVQIHSQPIPPPSDPHVMAYPSEQTPSSIGTGTASTAESAASTDSSARSHRSQSSVGLEFLEGHPDDCEAASDDRPLPQPWLGQRPQQRHSMSVSTHDAVVEDDTVTTATTSLPLSPRSSSESLTPVADSEGRSIVGSGSGNGQKIRRRLTFIRQHRSRARPCKRSSLTDTDVDTDSTSSSDC